MTRFLTLSCFLLCACFSVANSQSSPPFQFRFPQPLGEYAIGLKVVQQYDSSRTFSVDGGETLKSKRPLQTLFWYPAKYSEAIPMTLGDFEELISRETSFDTPSMHGPSQDFVHAFMQGTESEGTLSIRDAVPVPKRFPVIVYAPSLNAPSFENIELCEYLASNGFVVIASPSMGASTRHMQVNASEGAGEAADILFLIDFAKTVPEADVRKVGIIGYSWGGTGALLAAAADSRIRALVALDGSFRYDAPQNVDAGKIAIPLLFFNRGETPLATPEAAESPVEHDPRILNEWIHADVLQVRMLGISHIQFSSLYQRSERFRKEGLQFVPAGYSLADGNESYGWVARYTMAFLKANLMHDRNVRKLLTRRPAENGVPPRLIAVSFRPAV